MNASFSTELVISGALRSPAQMPADQVVDGHASVNDDSAGAMGLVDTNSGRTTAEVVLNSGVFEESYPDHPSDRLA